MQIFKYGPVEPYKPPVESSTKIDFQRILNDYIKFLAQVEKDSSLVNDKDFTDYLKITLKSLKANRLSSKRINSWSGKRGPEAVARYDAVAPRKNK